MKPNEDFTYLQDASEEELLKFIREIETAGLVTAPGNLKEQILKQVENEDKKPKRNKRVELFWYSVKIASAAAAAIFFISIIEPQTSYTLAAKVNMQESGHQEPKVQKLASFMNSATNELCGSLNRFSANIMRREW